MELNRANIGTLFTGVKTNILNGQKQASTIHQRIAMVVPSATGTEIFPIGMVPGKMREWLGKRLVKHVNTQLLTMANRQFELTIGIPQTAIEDDSYNIYSVNGAMGLGVAAANLWDDLVFEALIANGLWADGAAFFGTSRKYGKNTISNYTTGALTPATYDTARQAMMSYLDDDGSALNIVPDTLVVGPKLETLARRILENDYSYDATDKVQINNPYKGQAKVEVSTRLVGAAEDYWFLLASNGPIKPIIVLQRVIAEIARQGLPSDEPVFMDSEIRIGVRSRGAAALALPHLAYGGFVS